MPLTLVTIIILAATALAGAVALYFVSRRFHVNEDPKIDRIAALLPGANCGGCGFKGCRDFARACAEAKSLDGIYCPVGGESVMEKVAEITGLAHDAATPMTATLICNGACPARRPVALWRGPRSCADMALTGAGTLTCSYGCLGCGDCVASCAFGAMTLNSDTHLPEIDPTLCVACGQCVEACPRHLLKLIPKGKRDRRVWVACSNRDRGAAARKACDNACIACGKCVRECPFDAISIIDNRAVVDPTKCRACGKCVAVCPTGAIHTTIKTAAQ